MSESVDNASPGRGRKRPRIPDGEGARTTNMEHSSLPNTTATATAPAATHRETRQQQRANGRSCWNPSRPLGSTNERGGERKEDESNSTDHDDRYEDEDFSGVDVPSDTMATILSLQREFYGGSGALVGNSVGCSGRNARAEQGKARTGIVLHHQIYTVLQNRTAVDLELTALRHDNTLRTFRLSTGREDWAVMSTEHYLKLISNVHDATLVEDRGDAAVPTRSVGGRVKTGSGASGVVSKNRSSSSSSSDSSRGNSGAVEDVVRARDVLKHLVQTSRKAYISRKEVASAMREVLESRRRSVATDGRKPSEANGAGACRGVSGRVNLRVRPEGKVGNKLQEDVHGLELPDMIIIKREEAKVVSLVSELIRLGFLLPRRDVGREDAYWFSMPQLGKVIVAVSRGRKDILGMIKRTRYKEIRRSALESKNPAKTGLPLSFHIRDLLGLGMLREFDTPAGAFLRIASDP